MKQSSIDRNFDIINYSILTLVLLIVLYPLYFIVISSISNPDAVNAGEVFLYPKGITFEGYLRIFKDPSIMLGYKNTVYYTFLSTVISTALVLTSGYALSRKDLVGRNIFMFFVVFNMFFSGGLIPTYMLVKDLGMVNTIWALILPSAVSVYNVIITRTFFQNTIPDSLLEAAAMDGCTNMRFFLTIVLPLSLPIISVIVLFNAVNEWNSFFPALIYIRDKKLYPLQLILRDILVSSKSQVDQSMIEDLEEQAERTRLVDLIKYGVIIVASLPVLVLYPFLQKYFIKGVMIGAIKG